MPAAGRFGTVLDLRAAVIGAERPAGPDGRSDGSTPPTRHVRRTRPRGREIRQPSRTSPCALRIELARRRGPGRRRARSIPTRRSSTTPGMYRGRPWTPPRVADHAARAASRRSACVEGCPPLGGRRTERALGGVLRCSTLPPAPRALPGVRRSWVARDVPTARAVRRAIAGRTASSSGLRRVHGKITRVVPPDTVAIGDPATGPGDANALSAVPRRRRSSGSRRLRHGTRWRPFTNYRNQLSS